MYIKTCIESKLPLIDQMANGLQLHGVLDSVKKHKDQLRKVFVAQEQEHISADDLFAHLSHIFFKW